MYIKECRNELQDFLTKPTEKECKVVVMPDFFLDRIVNLPWNPDEFSCSVDDVSQRKGGSIDGVNQVDIKGGNAVNTASALTMLGASVTPILCTSEFGLQQIRCHFKGIRMDYSHIKVMGKASITTALEFRGEKEKINVMLRDVGALEDFGPSEITERDFDLIEKADYVCIFNWAGTRKHGTALAESVFGGAKQSCKGKTYCDTADPTPNVNEIPYFVEKVLKTSKVDILSVNENEAIIYAKVLDKAFGERRGKMSLADYALEAARVLARYCSARVDLHTSVFSASLKGKREVVVPTFKVEVFRATGAGDAWNAGNILADQNGVSDECRLMLANAVSACYLSVADGKHPTKDEVSRFLKINS